MKPIYAQDRSALRSEGPPFAGFYRVSAPLTSPQLPSHRIADLHAFALMVPQKWVLAFGALAQACVPCLQQMLALCRCERFLVRTNLTVRERALSQVSEKTNSF